MNDKIITGKFSRTVKTGTIVARAGLGQLEYLSTKAFFADPEAHRQKHEAAIGKILFKGLSQMRGTALKASQLLSFESDILPEGIRQELEKSCYQVPPINRALVRKAFMSEFGHSPQELFKEFSPTAFAAASLGQVHLATLHTGERAAVKIQYPGISESIDSDLKILSVVLSSLRLTTKLLPNNDVINTALNEIEIRLKEEIDYEKEAENLQWFKENLHLPNIRIPEVYHDLSGKKVISFEYLEGKHVDSWLASGPSQEEINAAGQTIFDTFIHCAFELKAIHADPHLGNFLFLDSGEIGLLDFGCVKYLDDEFPERIASLFRALLTREHTKVIEAYQNLNIFSESLTMEEYMKFVYPVIIPMQEWLVAPFRQEHYDFSLLPKPPKANYEHHKKAITYFHSFQRDQLYFDRTCIGVYFLLKKMGAKIRASNPWLG